MIRQWYDYEQYDPSAGIEPNQQFYGNMQQAINSAVPGLLGNVSNEDHEMVNYLETYGPKNVYASDLGTQARLLGSRLGILDAPNPLTLAEQELQAERDADMAAQAKAAQAAGKSFKAAMKAAEPEEEEQMKMLSPMFRAASAARPIAAPGGLSSFAPSYGLNRYLPRRA